MAHLKRSAISAAVVAVIGATAMSANAQTSLERVEITGSSIRRIAAEGALPVQIITAAQIAKSGATSVAEVIQKLPAMQGFQIADTAVGSNSGGIATASLHDIGASYTLVLLNGRRVAPTGSGSTINLNSIPMSAIDRIEVLTDGASALYGSDAIAGVVNFVLKRNQKGGSISARVNHPTEGGGQSANASVTYGAGDLEADGFSFVGTYRKDRNTQLKATDRSFGQTAYLPFEKDGKSYIYDRTSTLAVPANASVVFKTLQGEAASSRLPSYTFNPYQKANGKCAPMNVMSLNNASTATSVTQNCAFDFVNTIEIYPENYRDSLFLTGQFKINDKVRLFSDLAYSRLDLTARIAANPVPISIPLTSSLYSTYVLPFLTANQASHVNTVTANYRAQDFGTRDSQTVTDAKHFVVGAEADVGNWNLNGAFVWSQNAIDERYVGGYMKKNEFLSMVSNQQIDPFVTAGNASAATKQLISNAIFNGTIRTAETTQTGLDFKASGELMTLPSGALGLGLGGDLRKTSYRQTPDSRAVAGDIYNYAAVPAYDLARDTYGVFAELLIPVTKSLELTGAVRYDSISSIKDSVNNTTVGDTMSAPTYKMSARLQLSPQVLLRASYGTGFKAPAMLDIAQPEVPAGVTAASYDCPFPGTEACKPGKLQYSVLSGGNNLLKPEKSTQSVIGIRFEPSNDFGMGADYWQVKIRDAVSAVSANQAFGDPAKYSTLFKLYRTPAETQDYWAFRSVSTNIGQSINSGIDWDVVARFKTGMGRLTTGVSGTYLLESSYTRPGTDNDFTDSMNKYGENAAVSFKNVIRATATLDTDNWSHTFTYKYRNGYTDVNQTVRDVATNTNVKVSLDVPAYGTFDYQGTYNYSKSLEIQAGVTNLFNLAPPLTLRDSSGHQVGYDPRYADPFLRTIYVTGTLKF
ncbi:MAG: TonB-dependent receptor [Rhodoferax sp.]|nr:TonB-dependent receptor [Rhodoferax sp.]